MAIRRTRGKVTRLVFGGFTVGESDAAQESRPSRAEMIPGAPSAEGAPDLGGVLPRTEDQGDINGEPHAEPNILMPLLIGAFGIVFLLSLRNLSWQSKGYPVAAGSLLVIFSLVGLIAEIVRTFQKRRAASADGAPAGLGQAPTLLRQAQHLVWAFSKRNLAIGLAVVLFVAAIAAAERFGIYPAFAVYILVQMWFLRERNIVRLLIIDAATLILFYVVFVEALKMYLPLW